MWTVGLTVEIRLHFQIFLGVVLTGPQSFYRIRNFVATSKRICKFASFLDCYARECLPEHLKEVNHGISFELFWPRTKLPLNERKPENSSLLR